MLQQVPQGIQGPAATAYANQACKKKQTDSVGDSSWPLLKKWLIINFLLASGELEKQKKGPNIINVVDLANPLVLQRWAPSAQGFCAVETNSATFGWSKKAAV